MLNFVILKMMGYWVEAYRNFSIGWEGSVLNDS